MNSKRVVGVKAVVLITRRRILSLLLFYSTFHTFIIKHNRTGNNKEK